MPERGPTPEPTEEQPKIEVVHEKRPRERLNYEKLRQREDLQAQIEAIENRLRELDNLDAQNQGNRTELAKEHHRLDSERQALREELGVITSQIDEKGWEKIGETQVEEGPAAPALTETTTPPPEIPYYAPAPEEYTPPETPYAPEVPPYAPYSPEVGDFEQRAIEVINEIVGRDERRARERYRGLLGRVRAWFDREGRRQQAETLEQVGVWSKNPKWKKWLKIGAKIAGGAGIATAMVMTGGAGAVLTPLLWSGGVREAWDGALQTVEEIGWGRGRSRAELETQSTLSQTIDRLKERVRDGELTESEFQQLINRMIDADNEVSARQETNMGSERRWRLFRNITSTAATIGTGLLAGVPLGAHDYDKGPTAVGWGENKVFLDESHRVMWNLHGPHFLYNNPEEMARVAEAVSKIGIDKLPWTIHGAGVDTYHLASHMLGHGLPTAEKIGLGVAGAYLVGRWVEQYLPRRGGPRPPRGTYGPYGPIYYPPGTPYYGPSGPERPFYGPETGPRLIPERTVENERGVIERYLNSQNPAHLAELRRQNETLPAMTENCRLAVCIPASFAEHRIIYHTLEQYLGQETKEGQPLPPENFEINLFVNGPADKQEDINQTIAEVQRFQQDHPEIKVNLVSKAYTSGTTIGEIRKYINDLTILRGISRDRQEKPLYLVFHDADSEGMDKNYLDMITRTLDENPGLEAASTFEDYRNEVKKRYPLLHAARRLHQYAMMVMASPKYGPDPKMYGLFYGFRAASYAEVGGYKPEWWVAEDMNLSRELVRHSPDGREAVKKIPVKYYTSPRRTMAALERGIPQMEIYNEFGPTEPLRERRVRPVNLERMTLNNRRFLGELEKQTSGTFENIWARFFWPAFDHHPEVVARRRGQGREVNVDDLKRRLMADPTIGQKSIAEAIKIFDKSMKLWGAKYRLEQDQHGRFRVRITDWSRLREGLERAQAR